MQLKVGVVLIISAVMAAGLAMYLAFISPVISDFRIRVLTLIIASGLIIAAIIFSAISILFEAVLRKTSQSSRSTVPSIDAAVKVKSYMGSVSPLSELSKCMFQASS